MTNSIDHSQLLGQLRQLAEKSSSGRTTLTANVDSTPGVRPDAAGSATGVASGGSLATEQFSRVLEATLRDVNLQQLEAKQLAEAFERGERDVDVSQVMLEMQKARISFEALTQVRNKMIAAYQDIMNMPL